MIEFREVDDMTKEELKKEIEWIEQQRTERWSDIVLTYRLEDLEEEIATRET